MQYRPSVMFLTVAVCLFMFWGCHQQANVAGNSECVLDSVPDEVDHIFLLAGDLDAWLHDRPGQYGLQSESTFGVLPVAFSWPNKLALNSRTIESQLSIIAIETEQAVDILDDLPVAYYSIDGIEVQVAVLLISGGEILSSSRILDRISSDKEHFLGKLVVDRDLDIECIYMLVVGEMLVGNYQAMPDFGDNNAWKYIRSINAFMYKIRNP